MEQLASLHVMCWLASKAFHGLGQVIIAHAGLTWTPIAILRQQMMELLQPLEALIVMDVVPRSHHRNLQVNRAVILPSFRP